jgi:enoyl-CoA hydratase/carnithine racemase
MFEIVLSGPGKNSLGTTMMEHLLAKLGEAAGRPILVTGEGNTFSAGLDLKEVAASDGPGMERFLDRLVRLMDAWYTYPAPVVALVNGHAIAGGTVLALTCDYRVCTSDPTARLGLNEVALGLRFPPSLLTLARRRLPPQHFDTVILGAKLHPPAEALRLGIVDEVADDARAVAERVLRELAAHPAAAYASAKRELRPSFRDDAAERAFIADGLAAWTSPELKAMIAKMLDRSKK